MPHSDQHKKQSLLLHTCCGPCATHVIELLLQDYDVTAYFYNPNIQPEEEYLKRLGAIEKYCSAKDIVLLKGSYESKKWMDIAVSLQDEPEGGKRCEACFSFRLKETARFAKENSFPIFATTLTISPHKNAAVVNKAGQDASKTAKVQFLEADFKKGDGYRKSCELSKKLGLYRQSYCGCLYSKR
jgi:epoxyqueuosine reductase